jgi:VWFA-related protein
MGLGRLLSLVLTATTLLVAQQGIGPDEIRSRSGPYVPPPPPNTLRTEVNLVEVPVVVRDGKRHTVEGLTKDSFQVFDLGKRQEITAFSVEKLASTGLPSTEATDATPKPSAGTAAKPAVHPRFIALCFDNVSTPFADLRLTKTAAEKFVKTSLEPGDRVAIVTTAWAEPTINFTEEVPKLVESIEKVMPQPRFSDNDQSCPRITGYQAYVISNHLDNDTLEGVAQEDMGCKRVNHTQAVQDVTSLARMVWEHSMTVSTNTIYSIGGLVDTLGRLPGRRMLLFASSGFLSGNLEYLLQEMTTKALHAEVVINSLDSKGLYTMIPGRPIDAPPSRSRSPRTQIAELSIQSRQEGAKDDGMAALALGTGGAFYHNSNDLDKGFHELATTPDLVYVLGFAPSDATPDGRFHPLKVKLASGHYSVQSRLGYTARSKTPPPTQRLPSKMDTEVMATDTLNDVPIVLASSPGKTETGNPFLNVVVHVDVKVLKFDTQKDRRALKLNFLMALLAPGGGFIVGKHGEIEMAFTQATFDAIVGSGLNVTIPMQAPPGNYTLRGLVQESLEGKMSASSLHVEIR